MLLLVCFSLANHVFVLLLSCLFLQKLWWHGRTKSQLVKLSCLFVFLKKVDYVSMTPTATTLAQATTSLLWLLSVSSSWPPVFRFAPYSPLSTQQPERPSEQDRGNEGPLMTPNISCSTSWDKAEVCPKIPPEICACASAVQGC